MNEIIKLIILKYKFIILIYIYIYIFIYKLLGKNTPNKNNIFLNEKNVYFQKYLYLKNVKFFFNNSLKQKENILYLFSMKKPKNLTFIDKLFYKSDFNFGNNLVNLNKIIFYCEIIGCKSIILDKNSFWFIKKKSIIHSNNMTIEVGDYNNTLYFFNDSFNLFFSFFDFKPEIRINYLRNEIISNLPKIKISKDYLYIHIRSGDIFKDVKNIYYSQPPLCFYQNIIENFLFKKVFLISVDKNNPIIEKIIHQYPNLSFNQNSLPHDISYLISAYNIVGSISSFLYLIS